MRLINYSFRAFGILRACEPRLAGAAAAKTLSAAGFVAFLALLAVGHSSQAADIAATTGVSPAYVTPVVPLDPANRFEARFGAFAHGVGSAEHNTVDLNGEFLTPRLFAPEGPWAFLVPRLGAGGLLNLNGRTNVAYAAAVWTIPVFDRYFVEAFVGPAVHDGSLTATATRAGLGCDVLFNAGVSVGYRFNQNWSVMGTFDHLSNGKSLFGIDCGTNRAATGSNQGLNNYGVRLGYSF